MTKDNDKTEQYREEFEKEWNFVPLEKIGDAYIDDKVNMMWEVTKAKNAEIEKLKDSKRRMSVRAVKDMEERVNKIGDLKLEIDRLRAENEKLKAENEVFKNLSDDRDISLRVLDERISHIKDLVKRAKPWVEFCYREKATLMEENIRLKQWLADFKKEIGG